MPTLLTPEQVTKFETDGYLIVPNFFSDNTAKELLGHSRKLLTDFSVEGHPMTKFSTGGSSEHVGDKYFLDSGDKVHFFLKSQYPKTPLTKTSEEPITQSNDSRDAFDASGQLTRPKEQCINKIGHALHELDPVFRKFTLENDRLKAIAKDLQVHKDPQVLQSMVICKQPRIGGKVPIHDDSTFLFTDPPSALGFWFALEPCTKSNGCLSFVPGSHKVNRVHSRFVRKEGGGTGFENVEGVEKPSVDWEKENWVTEECSAGTLVLINGLIIHKSEKNLSDSSRFIYTFHMIEGSGAVSYDAKNWLQPTPAMPFSKLFS